MRFGRHAERHPALRAQAARAGRELQAIYDIEAAARLSAKKVSR